MQAVPTLDIRHTQTSIVAGHCYPMDAKTQCHADMWAEKHSEHAERHTLDVCLFQPMVLLRAWKLLPKSQGTIISTGAKMMAPLGKPLSRRGKRKVCTGTSSLPAGLGPEMQPLV